MLVEALRKHGIRGASGEDRRSYKGDKKQGKNRRRSRGKFLDGEGAEARMLLKILLFNLLIADLEEEMGRSEAGGKESIFLRVREWFNVAGREGEV